MLTRRQQEALKEAATRKGLTRTGGLWHSSYGAVACCFAAITIYALAHKGLVDFTESDTVVATPRGKTLVQLLDETTV